MPKSPYNIITSFGSNSIIPYTSKQKIYLQKFPKNILVLLLSELLPKKKLVLLNFFFVFRNTNYKRNKLAITGSDDITLPLHLSAYFRKNRGSSPKLVEALEFTKFDNVACLMRTLDKPCSHLQ